MTAQVSDRIVYRDTDYSIAGVKGDGLFNPWDHGLLTFGPTTACWRGNVCTYAVRTERLYLDSMRFYSESEDIAIFGVMPTPSTDEDHLGFAKEYLFPDQRVVYTGGILAASGFIEELYVHMGFHPAWKFEEVHELLFEDGDLIGAHDRSDAMARVRAELADRPLMHDMKGGRKAMEKWIDDCFSLDY